MEWRGIERQMVKYKIIEEEEEEEEEEEDKRESKTRWRTTRTITRRAAVPRNG